MKDLENNVKQPDSHGLVEKPRKAKPADVCEICGQKMERDPESGEYQCPFCYYSDGRE